MAKRHGYANNHKYMQATDTSPKQRRIAQRMIVLRAYHAQGPMTCDEFMERFGMPHQSAAARVSELYRDDPPLLIETGERRPTRLGKTAKVLRLSDEMQMIMDSVASRRGGAKAP